MNSTSAGFRKATPKELEFIREKAPRGMWKMIRVKTGKSRSQIDYQIRLSPENQDPDIIEAAREILYTVTGLCYHEKERSGHEH